MTVQDVMAKSPAVATPDTSIHQLARMMVEHDCGAIPVVESQQNPKPVGIITDRDIVVRLLADGRNPLEATAQDAMTEGAATVGHDQTIEQATQVMEQNQIRRIIVVDDAGSVIGIMSQADVALNAPAHEAAELLREVSEEEKLNSERMPMGGAYSS